MYKKMFVVALTLGLAFVLNAGAAAAAAKEPKKTDTARAFPITEKWSVEKLLSLTRDEVVALWKTLDPPPFTELNGHYMGIIPNAGDAATQKGTGNSMYNQNSDIGYWLGKAYKPTTSTTGEGYNRWRKPGGKVVRNMQFKTGLAKSLIDDKQSFMMYYGAYNKETTLTDELRKLDEYIYIGMGTTELENRKRSAPGHFILTGPTDEWVGVDKEADKK